MAKVYVGDTNTKIRLNAGIDISAASVLKIHYKKPDETTGEWTAVLEGTNYAYYLTLADTLDMNGTWSVQLYIEVGDWKGHGELTTFVVYDTIIDHSA